MGIISGDGLLSAGATIGAALINAKSANEQIQKQYETQKALYQQQFADQKQLIQEQNEYNSYSNQRKLMEEAGLNPALMYQNGAGGAIQSEVANPQVPQAPLLQGTGQMVAGALDKGIQTMMSLAQLKLLEAQVRKVDADTEEQSIKNRYTDEQIRQQLEQGKVNIEYTKNSIDKLLSDISLANQNISESASRIRLNSASVDKIMSEIPNNVKQGIILELQQQGVKYNNDLIAAKYIAQVQENGLISLRTALLQQQVRSTRLSADKTSSEIDFVKIDVLEKDWRYDYIERTGHTPEAGLWQSILGIIEHNFGPSSVNMPEPSTDGTEAADSALLSIPLWRQSPYQTFKEVPEARRRQKARKREME